MKKIILRSISLLLVLGLITGCSEKNKQKNDKPTISTETEEKLENQNYDGLEFVNVGVSNGIIKTVVINNTGMVYEGSKFSMKIMDEYGNVLAEIIDKVDNKVETGTTKIIETKINIDLTKVAAIEYSIVK